MKLVKESKKDKYGSFHMVSQPDRIRTPVISVVMSVYNGSKYLKEAIESIIKQTYKSWEFIIVNDGSTDGSMKMLLDYLKNERRIIIVDQKNMGLTRSLNRALMLSRGVYIARQDADDVSFPDRLSSEVDFLKPRPEYALVGSDYQVIGIKGKIENKMSKYFIFNDEEIRENMIRYNPFCHTSVLFKREILDNIGFYNERLKYSQDYEYWFRIMQEYKAANLPKILVYRRYTKEMLSRKHDKAQLYFIIKVQFIILKKSAKLNIKDLLYIFKNIVKYLMPGYLLKIIRSN